MKNIIINGEGWRGISDTSNTGKGGHCLHIFANICLYLCHIFTEREKYMEAQIVLIGAGTAGSALGRLLSKYFSVIILEAGLKEDRNRLISDPTVAGQLVLTYTNDFFWPLGHARLRSAPDNKRFPIVAGELWGGSSSVNGMQWVAGTAKYFKRLEEYTEDPAWGPINVFNTYREIEKFNGVPGQFDPKVHGFKGPFDIRQATRNLDAAQKFVDALVAQGYPFNPDYNDPRTPIGAFLYWQLSQKPNRTRETASSAYLDDLTRTKDGYINECKSLIVVPKAHVLRILFDTGDKCTARAVRVVINGKEVDIKASVAVISSAGIQSSLLLELSGIGDKELLSRLGIETIVNSPNVGRNILNHPIISLSGVGPVPSTTNPDPAGLYAGGAELLDPTDSNPTDRGFQLIGIDSPGPNGVFTVAGLLLDAKSRGTLHIENSDPLRMPFYDFRYFTDPRDIASAVALYGIQYNTLVKMGLSPILISGAPAPVPAVSQNPTDPTFIAIREYIVANYSQAYHWTGSSRMSKTIEDGVVNKNGRVHGTTNLYVADLTIYPFNVSGNGMAPAILAGNIIADKIIKKFAC